MPKEKVTRGKGKAAKADTGKKKKGTCPTYINGFRNPALNCTDPNAPKRGLSAYMFFANEQREKVREDNPGIKFGKLPPFHPNT